MEQAVESDPENVALRLHLAGLLVAADQHIRALEASEWVLHREPANEEALRLAATSADRLGQTTKANGYAALLGAMGGHSPLETPVADGPRQRSTNSTRSCEKSSRRPMSIRGDRRSSWTTSVDSRT